MSDWLTTEDKNAFLSGMQDLWDMFAKPIIIYKQPQYEAVSVSAGFVYGYGNIESTPTNYTFTNVSGIFSGILVSQLPNQIYDTNVEKTVPVADIYLKVKQDARDFILNGIPNEKIVYADKVYNIAGEEQITDYLDEYYYYFKLKLTT